MPATGSDRERLRRQSLKPRDFWWTVIVIDPIVVRLLPVLIRLRWVTPMGVSAVAIVVGLASIAGFAAGALVLGAVLYQLRFLLDCTDGKLARATGRSSAWGGFVDLAADTLMIAGAYAAVGYHVAQAEVAGAWVVLVLLPTYTLAVWVHQYERGVAAPGGAPPVEHPEGPVRVWSLDRLNRTPGSVEVETLLLLVFPVLLPLTWYPAVAGLASLFYLASTTEVVLDLRRRLGPAPATDAPGR